MNAVLSLVASLLVIACAHSQTPAASTTPTAVAAAPAPAAKASVTAEEKQLYDIVLRLAKDPAAQPELAPAARWSYRGEPNTGEPIENAVEELGWFADANTLLIAQAGEPPDTDETYMKCTAAELRCEIEQPGGTTWLTFAHYGEGAERRIVLSQVELSEP